MKGVTCGHYLSNGESNGQENGKSNLNWVYTGGL